jgi:hypothetical protein
MAFQLTPNVELIISKHLDTGYIINPYSDSWFESREGTELLNDQCENSIFLEDLANFDAEEGLAYRDHLFIVYIERSNTELIHDLSNLYSPIKELFEENGGKMFWPNFLFVNLKKSKIFCVGVGRNKTLFGFDVDEYVNKSTPSFDQSNLYNIYDKCCDYFEEFRQLDFFEFIANIIANLEELSIANEIHEQLMIGSDDNQASTEKVNKNIERLNTAIEGLKIFFPMIDPGELNP